MILPANSACRGAIRAGQFSQLATVMQTGGEDGMWTFGRYDRWIAQKSDWTLPQRQQTTASSKSPSTTQWTSTRSPSGSESRATGDNQRTPAFEPLAAERAEPVTKLLCSIYSERS